MRDGKLGNKSRSENMVHLWQIHIQKRIVMYNFANKVAEWRAKHGIVGNKSWMSTDRPEY